MDTVAGSSAEQMDCWSVTPGVRKPLRHLLLTVPLFVMSLCATIAAFSGWMLAGTAFFGLCVSQPLARLIRPGRVAVRLDSAGIVVRPVLGRGGEVAWSEVRHVWIQGVRAPAGGPRIRTVVVGRLRGRTLGLPEADIACSADEVVAAIHHYRQRYDCHVKTPRLAATRRRHLRTRRAIRRRGGPARSAGAPGAPRSPASRGRAPTRGRS